MSGIEFGEKVHFKHHLGSGKLEKLNARWKEGIFVGISETFGHGMTFKILNSSINNTINRSNVRLAENK